MKIFKMKFNGMYYVLLVIGIIFSLMGLGLNIFNAIEFSNYNITKTVLSIIISVICLLTFIVLIAILFRSKYVLGDKKITCYLGLYKGVVKTDEISEILHLQSENKLIIYYGEKKYFALLVSPEQYNDFISSLLKINPNIGYTTNINGK